MQSPGRTSDLLLIPGAGHGFSAAEEGVARPAGDAFPARSLR